MITLKSDSWIMLLAREGGLHGEQFNSCQLFGALIKCFLLLMLFGTLFVLLMMGTVIWPIFLLAYWRAGFGIPDSGWNGVMCVVYGLVVAHLVGVGFKAVSDLYQAYKVKSFKPAKWETKQPSMIKVLWQSWRDKVCIRITVKD